MMTNGRLATAYKQRRVCPYCSTPRDETGEPIGEIRQLPGGGLALCFACGSVVAREDGPERHCACPHCAEREFRRWPYRAMH
ncbi:hypothetical protein [Parapedobacter sp.]